MLTFLLTFLFHRVKKEVSVIEDLRAKKEKTQERSRVNQVKDHKNSLEQSKTC